jgi:hypothetical protein
MELGLTWVACAVDAMLLTLIFLLIAYWYRNRAVPSAHCEPLLKRRWLRLYRLTAFLVYFALIIWYHVAGIRSAQAVDGLPENFTAWNTHLQAVWWGVAAAAPPHSAAARRSHLLFETVLPSAWFVTFVAAFILAPGNPMILASGEHFWNSVALTVDARWNEIVLSKHHALLPVVWASLYMIRSWVRRSAQIDYVWNYTFLELDSGIAMVWYGMLVVVNVAVYQACAWVTARKLRRLLPPTPSEAEAPKTKTPGAQTPISVALSVASTPVSSTIELVINQT